MKATGAGGVALATALGIAQPAWAQDRAAEPLSLVEAELRLDAEMKRQHELRVSAYERLKGRLDTSINASAEARNLAVGSALQIMTPVTDVKVQQMQLRQMGR